MQKQFKKIMAAALAVMMALTGYPSVPAHAATGALGVSADFPADLSSLAIPGRLGRIQEAYLKDRGKTVLLIQDAHAVPEAARSIAGLIRFFEKEYGISLVALEGARGRLDAGLFRSFPDKARLKKVFKRIHDRGELAGVSAAALFGDNPGTTFEGLEDWPVYEEGYRHFQEALRQEETLTQKVETLQAELLRKKKTVYDSQTLAFDSAAESFYTDKISLPELLKVLSRFNVPAQSAGLQALLTELKTSEAAQGDLHREAAALAEQFLKSSGGRLDSRESAKFNRKRQELQTGALSPGAFAHDFRALARTRGVRLSLPPALRSAVRSERKLRDLEGTQFMQELEQWMKEIKTRLFRTDAERSLDAESRRLYLLKKLASLELSYREWQETQKLDENASFKSARAFYQNAEKRDGVIFKNLSRLMKKYPARDSRLNIFEKALVVTGGFHAQGLTQRFRENGISYLVITPTIRELPEKSSYKAQMQGHVAWKKYFKTGSDGRVNLYDAFARYVRDDLLAASGKGLAAGEAGDFDPLNADRSTLKFWRDQIIRDLADQGRAGEAGRYTRFLDELNPAAQKDGADFYPLSTDFLKRLRGFIDGLRGLKETNRINEQNILNLLSAHTLGVAAVNGQLASKLTLPAKVLGVEAEGMRSEMPRDGSRETSRDASRTMRSEMRSTSQPDDLHPKKDPAPLPEAYLPPALMGRTENTGEALLRDLRNQLFKGSVTFPAQTPLKAAFWDEEDEEYIGTYRDAFVARQVVRDYFDIINSGEIFYRQMADLAHELVTNILDHGNHGVLEVRRIEEGGKEFYDFISDDQGPGIENPGEIALASETRGRRGHGFRIINELTAAHVEIFSLGKHWIRNATGIYELAGTSDRVAGTRIVIHVPYQPSRRSEMRNLSKELGVRLGLPAAALGLGILSTFLTKGIESLPVSAAAMRGLQFALGSLTALVMVSSANFMGQWRMSGLQPSWKRALRFAGIIQIAFLFWFFMKPLLRIYLNDFGPAAMIAVDTLLSLVLSRFMSYLIFKAEKQTPEKIRQSMREKFWLGYGLNSAIWSVFNAGIYSIPQDWAWTIPIASDTVGFFMGVTFAGYLYGESVKGRMPAIWRRIGMLTPAVSGAVAGFYLLGPALGTPLGILSGGLLGVLWSFLIARPYGMQMIEEIPGVKPLPVSKAGKLVAEAPDGFLRLLSEKKIRLILDPKKLRRLWVVPSLWPWRKTELRQAGRGDFAQVFVYPGHRGAVKVARDLSFHLWAERDHLQEIKNSLPDLVRRGAIPEVVQQGFLDKVFYLVLAGPADAKTLGELEENPKILFLRRLQIILEAGRILKELNQAGWTHSDVKAKNILVGDNGQGPVQIIDFGIARSARHRDFQDLIDLCLTAKIFLASAPDFQISENEMTKFSNAQTWDEFIETLESWRARDASRTIRSEMRRDGSRDTSVNSAVPRSEMRMFERRVVFELPESAMSPSRISGERSVTEARMMHVTNRSQQRFLEDALGPHWRDEIGEHPPLFVFFQIRGDESRPLAIFALRLKGGVIKIPLVDILNQSFVPGETDWGPAFGALQHEIVREGVFDYEMQDWKSEKIRLLRMTHSAHPGRLTVHPVFYHSVMMTETENEPRRPVLSIDYLPRVVSRQSGRERFVQWYGGFDRESFDRSLITPESDRYGMWHGRGHLAWFGDRVFARELGESATPFEIRPFKAEPQRHAKPPLAVQDVLNTFFEATSALTAHANKKKIRRTEDGSLPPWLFWRVEAHFRPSREGTRGVYEIDMTVHDPLREAAYGYRVFMARKTVERRGVKKQKEIVRAYEHPSPRSPFVIPVEDEEKARFIIDLARMTMALDQQWNENGFLTGTPQRDHFRESVRDWLRASRSEMRPGGERHSRFLHQGKLTRQSFDTLRSAFERKEVTTKFRERVIAVFTEVAKRAYLSDEKQALFKKRVAELKSGELKIYSIPPQSLGPEDYLEGLYDDARHKLYVSEDYLAFLAGRGPPVEDYDRKLFHEVMYPARKVLVLGASGFLGGEIHQTLSRTYPDVVGTAHTKAGEGWVPVDVTREADIVKLLEQEKPDAIVYAAGVADLQQAENDRDQALRLNAAVPEMLARHFKGQLIYLSTDYVFDGKAPPYAPSAEAAPLNFYGQTKIKGEQAVLAHSQNAVIRFGLVYGADNLTLRDPLQQFVLHMEGFQQGDAPLVLDDTQIRHPVWIQDIADLAVNSVNERTQGVLQINGDEGLTKLQFARAIEKVYREAAARESMKSEAPPAGPFWTAPAAPQGGIARPQNAQMQNSAIPTPLSDALDSMISRHEGLTPRHVYQALVTGDAKTFNRLTQALTRKGIRWVITGSPEKLPPWQGAKPAVYRYADRARIHDILTQGFEMTVISRIRMDRAIDAGILSSPESELQVLFSKKVQGAGNEPYFELGMLSSHPNANALTYLSLHGYNESMSGGVSRKIWVPLQAKEDLSVVSKRLRGGSFSTVQRLLLPDGHTLIEKRAVIAEDGGKLREEAGYMRRLQESGEPAGKWFPRIFSIREDAGETRVEMEDMPWPNLSDVIHWSFPQEAFDFEGLRRSQISRKTLLQVAQDIYRTLTPDFYSQKQSETPPDFLERYHFQKVEKRWQEAAEKSEFVRRLLAAPYLEFGDEAPSLMPNLGAMMQVLQRITAAHPKFFMPPYLSKQHGDLHAGNILVDPFDYIASGEIRHVKLVDPKYMPEGNDPLYDFAKLLHNYFGHYDLAIDHSQTFRFIVDFPEEVQAPASFYADIDDEAMGTKTTLSRINLFNQELIGFLQSANSDRLFPFEKDPIAWRMRLLFTHATLMAGLLPYHAASDAKVSVIYERTAHLLYMLIDALHAQGMLKKTAGLHKAWAALEKARVKNNRSAFAKALHQMEAAIVARSEMRSADETTKGGAVQDPFHFQMMEQTKDEDFWQWFEAPGRSRDRELFNRIVASGDAGLRALLAQYPEKIYVKEVVNEQGTFVLDPDDGRTVYLKLTEPFGEITELRLKGVRLRRGKEEPIEAYGYDGKGYVPVEVSVKAPGQLVFKKKPAGYKAFGGASLESTLNEQGVLERTRAAGLGDHVDFPLGTGQYLDADFQGRPLGFSVIGMRGTDRRFAVLVEKDEEDDDDERSLFFYLKDYEKHYPLVPADARSFLHSLGVILRQYHDAGFYHLYPHFGNFGLKAGADLAKIMPADLVIRDMGSTSERSRLPDLPQEKTALAATHRLLDITKVLRYLRRTDRPLSNLYTLEKEFLQGYFGAAAGERVYKDAISYTFYMYMDPYFLESRYRDDTGEVIFDFNQPQHESYRKLLKELTVVEDASEGAPPQRWRAGRHPDGGQAEKSRSEMRVNPEAATLSFEVVRERAERIKTMGRQDVAALFAHVLKNDLNPMNLALQFFKMAAENKVTVPDEKKSAKIHTLSHRAEKAADFLEEVMENLYYMGPQPAMGALATRHTTPALGQAVDGWTDEDWDSAKLTPGEREILNRQGLDLPVLVPALKAQFRSFYTRIPLADTQGGLTLDFEKLELPYRKLETFVTEVIRALRDGHEPMHAELARMNIDMPSSTPLAVARSETRRVSPALISPIKISEADAKNILSQTSISGDPYPELGGSLTTDMLEQNGMAPAWQLTLQEFGRPREYYFSGRVFDIDKGHVATIAYVESVNPGTGNLARGRTRFVARTYYRSRSHGGQWRFLPSAKISGEHSGRLRIKKLDKGYSQESVTLDYEIQYALDFISRRNTIHRFENSLTRYLILAGTTKRPLVSGEENAQEDEDALSYGRQVDAHPSGPVLNLKPYPGEGELTPPGQLKVSKLRMKPVLKKIIAQFDMLSDLYTDGVPDEYLQGDGQLTRLLTQRQGNIKFTKVDSQTFPAQTLKFYGVFGQVVKTLTVTEFEDGTKALYHYPRWADRRPEAVTVKKSDGSSESPRVAMNDDRGLATVVLPNGMTQVFDQQRGLIKESLNGVEREYHYGLVTVRVFHSADGNLEYSAIQDKLGRVMYGSILNPHSPRTALGLRQSRPDFWDMTAPIYEYEDDSGGYGDFLDSLENYFSLWRYYLGKTPMIREFREFFPEVPLDADVALIANEQQPPSFDPIAMVPIEMGQAGLARVHVLIGSAGQIRIDKIDGDTFEAGHEFILPDGGTMTFSGGRKPTAEADHKIIFGKASGVSNNHFKIYLNRMENKIEIRASDLKSKNGTYFHGGQIGHDPEYLRGITLPAEAKSEMRSAGPVSLRVFNDGDGYYGVSDFSVELSVAEQERLKNHFVDPLTSNARAATRQAELAEIVNAFEEYLTFPGWDLVPAPWNVAEKPNSEQGFKCSNCMDWSRTLAVFIKFIESQGWLQFNRLYGYATTAELNHHVAVALSGAALITDPKSAEAQADLIVMDAWFKDFKLPIALIPFTDWHAQLLHAGLYYEPTATAFYAGIEYAPTVEDALNNSYRFVQPLGRGYTGVLPRPASPLYDALRLLRAAPKEPPEAARIALIEIRKKSDHQIALFEDGQEKVVLPVGSGVATWVGDWERGQVQAGRVLRTIESLRNGRAIAGWKFNDDPESRLLRLSLQASDEQPAQDILVTRIGATLTEPLRSEMRTKVTLNPVKKILREGSEAVLQAWKQDWLSGDVLTDRLSITRNGAHSLAIHFLDAAGERVAKPTEGEPLKTYVTIVQEPDEPKHINLIGGSGYPGIAGKEVLRGLLRWLRSYGITQVQFKDTEYDETRPDDDTFMRRVFKDWDKTRRVKPETPVGNLLPGQNPPRTVFYLERLNLEKMSELKEVLESAPALITRDGLGKVVDASALTLTESDRALLAKRLTIIYGAAFPPNQWYEAYRQVATWVGLLTSRDFKILVMADEQGEVRGMLLAHNYETVPEAELVLIASFPDPIKGKETLLMDAFFKWFPTTRSETRRVSPLETRLSGTRSARAEMRSGEVPQYPQVDSAEAARELLRTAPKVALNNAILPARPGLHYRVVTGAAALEKLLQTAAVGSGQFGRPAAWIEPKAAIRQIEKAHQVPSDFSLILEINAKTADQYAPKIIDLKPPALANKRIYLKDRKGVRYLNRIPLPAINRVWLVGKDMRALEITLKDKRQSAQPMEKSVAGITEPESLPQTVQAALKDARMQGYLESESYQSKTPEDRLAAIAGRMERYGYGLADRNLGHLYDDLPARLGFSAGKKDVQRVNLTLDEYETLRRITGDSNLRKKLRQPAFQTQLRSEREEEFWRMTFAKEPAFAEKDRSDLQSGLPAVIKALLHGENPALYSRAETRRVSAAVSTAIQERILKVLEVKSLLGIPLKMQTLIDWLESLRPGVQPELTGQQAGESEFLAWHLRLLRYDLSTNQRDFQKNIRSATQFLQEHWPEETARLPIPQGLAAPGGGVYAGKDYEGKLTLGNTTPTERSQSLDYEVLHYLRSRKQPGLAKVVDLGVGYPPLTTIQTAKKTAGLAEVIGVDLNMPSYVIHFPNDYGYEYHVFFEKTLDGPDPVTFAVQQTNVRTGILVYQELSGEERAYAVAKALEHRNRLLEQLGPAGRLERIIALQNAYDRHKGGVPLEQLGVTKNDFKELRDFYAQKPPLDEKVRLTVEPVRRQSLRVKGLRFQKAGFELSGIDQADIIRAANVFHYYDIQAARNAVKSMGSKLKEGGVLIVARDDDNSLVFKKQNGHLIPQVLTSRIRPYDLPTYYHEIFPELSKLFMDTARAISNASSHQEFSGRTAEAGRTLQAAGYQIETDLAEGFLRVHIGPTAFEWLADISARNEMRTTTASSAARQTGFPVQPGYLANLHQLWDLMDAFEQEQGTLAAASSYGLFGESSRTMLEEAVGHFQSWKLDAGPEHSTFDFQPSYRGLEVGAGNGLTALSLGLMEGWSVDGIELDPERANRAEQFVRYAAERGFSYPNVRLQQGDFLQWNLRPYDLIYFYFSPPLDPATHRLRSDLSLHFTRRVLDRLNDELALGSVFISPAFGLGLDRETVNALLAEYPGLEAARIVLEQQEAVRINRRMEKRSEMRRPSKEDLIAEIAKKTQHPQEKVAALFNHYPEDVQVRFFESLKRFIANLPAGADPKNLGSLLLHFGGKHDFFGGPQKTEPFSVRQMQLLLALLDKAAPGMSHIADPDGVFIQLYRLIKPFQNDADLDLLDELIRALERHHDLSAIVTTFVDIVVQSKPQHFDNLWAVFRWYRVNPEKPLQLVIAGAVPDLIRRVENAADVPLYLGALPDYAQPFIEKLDLIHNRITSFFQNQAKYDDPGYLKSLLAGLIQDVEEYDEEITPRDVHDRMVYMERSIFDAFREGVALALSYSEKAHEFGDVLQVLPRIIFKDGFSVEQSAFVATTYFREGAEILKPDALADGQRHIAFMNYLKIADNLLSDPVNLAELFEADPPVVLDARLFDAETRRKNIAQWIPGGLAKSTRYRLLTHLSQASQIALMSDAELMGAGMADLAEALQAYNETTDRPVEVEMQVDDGPSMNADEIALYASFKRVPLKPRELDAALALVNHERELQQAILVELELARAGIADSRLQGNIARLLIDGFQNSLPEAERESKLRAYLDYDFAEHAIAAAAMQSWIQKSDAVLKSGLVSGRSENRVVAETFVRALASGEVSSENLKQAAVNAAQPGVVDAVLAQLERIYQDFSERLARGETTVSLGGAPIAIQAVQALIQVFHKRLAEKSFAPGRYAVTYLMPKSDNEAEVLGRVLAQFSGSLGQVIFSKTAPDQKIPAKLQKILQDLGIMTSTTRGLQRAPEFASEQQVSGVAGSAAEVDALEPEERFVPVVSLDMESSDDPLMAELVLTLQTAAALLIASRVRQVGEIAEVRREAVALLHEIFPEAVTEILQPHGSGVAISGAALRDFIAEWAAAEGIQQSA